MTPEQRRTFGRRLSIARRRLVSADELVEVGQLGRARLWRAVLADNPAARLEREASVALRGDDAGAADAALSRLERAVARAVQPGVAP
ncbi:MAG TPA: hypothetical protein VFI09_08170 [Solirubrobacterales bacterium]|nr:hypothetical protein [Solirubrobacterales bacterium]